MNYERYIRPFLQRMAKGNFYSQTFDGEHFSVLIYTWQPGM